MKVGEFIQNGVLSLPAQLSLLFGDLQHITISGDNVDDELIWEGAYLGVLTVKGDFEYYRDKGVKNSRYSKLWQPYIPPKLVFRMDMLA